MFQDNKKWVYLIILSLIWGSSFILIKKGLIGLTPLQLGALRILISGFFVFLFGFNTLKEVPKSKWKWLIISGFIGTFFPVFLFAYAETEIDSAVASILNSLVPLNHTSMPKPFHPSLTLTRKLHGWEKLKTSAKLKASIIKKACSPGLPADAPSALDVTTA